jgi:exodeoxyribonuclease VII large subunit
MNRNLLRRATSQDWLAGRLRQAHPGMRLLHQAQRLDDLEQRLGSCTRRTLERAGSRLHATRLQLSRFSPLGQVRELSNRRAELHLRLRGAVEARVRAVHRRVELAMRALHAVSPLATLERGYAIVMRAADGAVLRSAAQVKPDDEIEARLAKGRITARVKDVKE